MGNPTSILQVCISCKRASDESSTASSDVVEGRLLYEGLKDAIHSHPTLQTKVRVLPVECMNGCKSSCTVALRADDKFTFVVGELDASADRVEDVVSFTQSYTEAENGLPQWRDRPVHIRKNTLARLHPIAVSSEQE